MLLLLGIAGWLLCLPCATTSSRLRNRLPKGPAGTSELPPCSLPSRLSSYQNGRSSSSATCGLFVAAQLEPSYEHIDFTWGIDAQVRIYPAILRLLQQYHGGGAGAGSGAGS